MKTLFLLLTLISSVSYSYAQGGYRCEGYCGGLDTDRGVFYDRGYLITEYPDSAEQAYKKLLSKCQKQMPMGIHARIYKNIEVTREERRVIESWRTHESGYDVFYGYRWIQILPSSSGSSYYYSERQSRSTIKVDSLTSKESCEYDQSITVPYYDGDLPVQG